MPPVHVHLTTVAEARAAGVLEAYRARLTDEERARHARMRPDPRGDEFLVGRALLHHALERHAPGWPRRFIARPHGRLEVAGLPVSFNLAHAEGLVVVAVADSLVGVDVEKVDPGRTERAVWEDHFAPPEIAALAALPPAEQCERFFRYWTLKEAYLKARGMGLGALPLREFWFQLEPSIRIVFSPALPDAPGRWRFAQLRVGTDFLLAVALVAREPIALSVERGLPQAGELF